MAPNPRASGAGSEVFVTATLELNNKPGEILYSVTGRAATPFQGGFLCLAPPVRRTPGVNSGGTAPPVSDCSGVYTMDMNAFAAGLLGGNPDPALALPGTVVRCQWWGRDPGFAPPNNSSLTSALEYAVGF